jgi:acyl CoA:acetate/3-ketoacid CoA transferase
VANPTCAQVVVAPPELHWQTFAGPHMDGTLTGALKAPGAHLAPLALTPRRAIAFRAMLEIDRPRALVNVGVGMPEVRRASVAEGHRQSV